MSEVYGTFKLEEPVSTHNMLTGLEKVKSKTSSGFNFRLSPYHIESHPGEKPTVLAISAQGAIYRGQLRVELSASPAKGGTDPFQSYFSAIDLLEHAGWASIERSASEQKDLDSYIIEIGKAFEETFKGEWGGKIKRMCSAESSLDRFKLGKK